MTLPRSLPDTEASILATLRETQPERERLLVGYQSIRDWLASIGLPRGRDTVARWRQLMAAPISYGGSGRKRDTAPTTTTHALLAWLLGSPRAWPVRRRLTIGANLSRQGRRRVASRRAPAQADRSRQAGAPDNLSGEASMIPDVYGVAVAVAVAAQASNRAAGEIASGRKVDA